MSARTSSARKSSARNGMKVKRFLLRYDPKGVGIEIETIATGVLDVKHKNLPPDSQVTSPAEVKLVVEKLISEEPDLLSKTRHWTALLQLVSRLYSIEMPPDAMVDASAPSHRKNSARGDAGVNFQEGQRVVLLALEDAALNGRIGTVVKARPDRERYEVELAEDGQQREKVKGVQHLVAVVTDGKLAQGSAVALCGLRSHPEMNGCIGKVEECYEEMNRYEVRSMATKQLFRVKQDNLILVEAHAQLTHEPPPAKENLEPDENPNPNGPSTPRLKKGGPSNNSLKAGIDAEGNFEPGMMVQLCGLKSAAKYNGQTAEVVTVDQTRGRYEIRMSDGSMKTVKADNVRCVETRPRVPGRMA